MMRIPKRPRWRRVLLISLGSLIVGALVAIFLNHTYSPDPDQGLSATEMQEDIDVVLDAVEQHYAYATLHPQAVEDLRALRGSMPVVSTTLHLACSLQACLSRFGDGHTGVRDMGELWGEFGVLPYTFITWQDQVIVLQEDGNLVRSDHSILIAINDIPVEDLIREIRRFVPFTAERTARRAATQRLRYAPWLLQRINGAAPAAITLTLAERNGHTVTATAEIHEHELNTASTEVPKLHTLPGGIAHLRLPSFNTEIDQNMVEAWMDELDKSTGLVIDVRDNGGGNRQALVRLAPYFIDVPVVVNAALLRTDAWDIPGESVLMDRYMFPEASSYWSAEQRDAIQAFRTEFIPQWEPDPEHFSSWHYMVLQPNGERRYTKPIVLLQNEGCFSATDIFCSALDQMENVTIVGTPTGGGSGRPITYDLPNSHLRVRLSSMASFRPDGTLFEGHGVEPDILVSPTINDLLTGSDTLLDIAVSLIQRGTMIP